MTGLSSSIKSQGVAQLIHPFNFVPSEFNEWIKNLEIYVLLNDVAPDKVNLLFIILLLLFTILLCFWLIMISINEKRYDTVKGCDVVSNVAPSGQIWIGMSYNQ